MRREIKGGGRRVYSEGRSREKEGKVLKGRGWKSVEGKEFKGRKIQG